MLDPGCFTSAAALECNIAACGGVIASAVGRRAISDFHVTHGLTCVKISATSANRSLR